MAFVTLVKGKKQSSTKRSGARWSNSNGDSPPEIRFYWHDRFGYQGLPLMCRGDQGERRNTQAPWVQSFVWFGWQCEDWRLNLGEFLICLEWRVSLHPRVSKWHSTMTKTESTPISQNCWPRHRPKPRPIFQHIGLKLHPVNSKLRSRVVMYFNPRTRPQSTLLDSIPRSQPSTLGMLVRVAARSFQRVQDKRLTLRESDTKNS